MPRKLQPNQVVTYKKKITYVNPQNEQKAFFDSFWGIFLIQVVAIATGIATAGLGSAAVAGAGLTQLGSAIASSAIQTTVNFAVSTFFDAVRNDVTTQNLIFNAVFAVTDIGKIGRALKEDKLLKLVNQSGILKEIGIEGQIKNFYQLSNQLALKDVILKDQTKIAFGKTVTDAQILASIFQVSNASMKKEIKSLTYEQLKSYLEIQRVIQQINPSLIYAKTTVKTSKLDLILKNELNVSYDQFLRFDDLDAFNALTKLSTTKVGNNTLAELNNLRMQSKFQDSLLITYKKNLKSFKNKAKKLNPFYWANKLVNDATKPLEDAIKELHQTAVAKYFPKLNKVGKDLVKKYNLIPCQEKSFLLAYKFEMTGIDGTGMLHIWKKPYKWKKTAKISSYNSVRVWSNLKEVQEFATSSNQDIYYNENFALGHGFRQSKLSSLSLLTPGTRKAYKEIMRFQTKIRVLKTILRVGVLESIKSKSRKEANKQKNKLINKTINNAISFFPAGMIFSSSIIKSIKKGRWDNSWARNDIANHTRKKTIKKVVQIKHAI
ncbi:putative c-terminal truncated transmembrane protein [Mesoplasma florum W37]|uniref:Uncharacterized protein n=1 Tax=Mesoplasma florum TaxID=2151 RepID=A0AAD0HSK0_MESFO|nr:hypothetical protein [Mesoplasma florum]AGY41645.1 putative c-terminal truncated transmembrane protein [Mesoplasma florum W37]AVN59849.1 hypothetical protein CG008_03060 [Mesoplasma florum]AVN65983.1 hypothetical protein MflW12_5780 [Mesoplasma florum]